ncbi:MAG: Trm112 family protein [Planctomycetota bacterium]
MIQQSLLNLIQCPLSGERLHLAQPELIESLNKKIRAGEVRDHADQRVEDPIEGGLVTESAERLYPVRGGIPALLVDQSIRIGG